MGLSTLYDLYISFGYLLSLNITDFECRFSQLNPDGSTDYSFLENYESVVSHFLFISNFIISFSHCFLDIVFAIGRFDKDLIAGKPMKSLF